MLTLRPRAWYSWDFRVEEDGREVALIDRKWWRESSSFEHSGVRYDVRRTSVLRGTFVLERSGTLVAEARKVSAFRRAFEISVGGERYELRAASIFGRRFDLWQQGGVVGTIRPLSIFRRTAEASLPEWLPREVRIFVVVLVLTLWKRESDAAAAG